MSPSYDRRPSTLIVALWTIIALCGAFTFFGNLRFGKDVLGVGFEDDFFYYLQVGKNLALHGRSTFDGFHKTNGYHPLWLLVITLIIKVLDLIGLFNRTNVVPLAIALETLQFFLFLVTSFFCFRLCSIFRSAAVSVSITLLFASWDLIMVRTGMEVGLALGAVLGAFLFRLRSEFRWSTRDSAMYGLLCGVLILSRLDTILLVALLVVFDVAPTLLIDANRVFKAACFAAGMIPVAAYVLINEIVFQTALPVSGMAKQLRVRHFPSPNALGSFASYLFAKNSPLLGLTVLCTILALIVFLPWAPLRRIRDRRGFQASLLFPFLHLLVISTLSDWELWPWYLYPWLISGVFAAIALFGSRPKQSARTAVSGKIGVFTSTVFMVLYSCEIVRHSNPLHDLPYVAALDIQRFSITHPGIYAMGDRAGSVGYLIDDPLIQTEGLVMDKDFLNNIRSRKDLTQVLHDNKVRYYIAARTAPDVHGCYPVKEPWVAGPDSPVMEATICRSPVAVFQYGYHVNDIFDLQDENTP